VTLAHLLAASAGTPVSVPYCIWAYLAFHRDRGPVPLPRDVQIDPPSPLIPSEPFRPDRVLFRATLARLPEVRQPWLREIYDRHGSFSGPPF
jgi:hypothetical protein